MEIVTDPDMRSVEYTESPSMDSDECRSSEEAGIFVKRLQGLLRRLRSGDGDMEKVGDRLSHLLMDPREI
jgi:Asp-tRNA(Asn)/Glu-tRNA(Gln) amidotransferase B subunit